MSLIVLEQATLRYGDQTILDSVSVRIGEGEKIGLVGPNGAGKSTLLRVMMGTQQLDGGHVRTSRGLRIGYLPQELQDNPEGELLRSVLASVPGRTDTEAQLEEVDAALAIATDHDEQMTLATRLGDLSERLDHFDRFYSEHQAIRILGGLGFTEDDLRRPVAEFSGGWRMRAALAGLLFQQPDVLFMDEPTNHLDMPSVLWLNNFLNELRSAMILICHDRDFLNKQVKRILTFEAEGLESYTGNYDDYIRQREATAAVREAEYRNKEKEMKALQAFVNRFKAKASKARQAQSRAKVLKKMQAELEAGNSTQRRRSLSFSFPEVERTGRDVLRMEGLGKSFGDHVLYSGLDNGIYAGDRIAIVGVNGAGKTTLLKMLARELEPTAGTVTYGSNVKLGYYAQHHDEQLTRELTVLDEVRRAKPAASEQWLRGVCGAFLFSRDEVDKLVGVLSGGERARVLLAKLLVEPGNLLMMDEPTNHLDVAAADALAAALARYGGTLLFVSHNTAFVSALATRVWDIGNGEVIDYPGTFAEYLAQKEAIALAEAPTDKPARGKQKPNKKLAKAEAKRQVKTEVKTEARPASDSEPPAEEEGRRKRKKRKRNRGGGAGPALDDEQHRHLQERIDELKVGMKELEAELADPNLFNDRVGFDKVLAQFTERQKKHEQLSARLTGTSEPERSEPEPPPREDNVRRGTLKRRKKH